MSLCSSILNLVPRLNEPFLRALSCVSLIHSSNLSRAFNRSSNSNSPKPLVRPSVRPLCASHVLHAPLYADLVVAPVLLRSTRLSDRLLSSHHHTRDLARVHPSLSPTLLLQSTITTPIHPTLSGNVCCHTRCQSRPQASLDRRRLEGRFRILCRIEASPLQDADEGIGVGGWSR